MKELTIEEKAKLYDKALEKARQLCAYPTSKPFISDLQDLFPELKESEDERIRKEIIAIFKGKTPYTSAEDAKRYIAWLEKQGSEPNWYHHKVDLSDCSEEYRKAYYDGWNNCNMQHSQYKSESNDVVKCLINGMKFYYEDNEEATWGTEKFSMKVKDILSWLEKQGEKKPYGQREECLDCQVNYADECKGSCQMKRDEQKLAWSEEDETYLDLINTAVKLYYTDDKGKENPWRNELLRWLKSLKERIGG